MIITNLIFFKKKKDLVNKYKNKNKLPTFLSFFIHIETKKYQVFDGYKIFFLKFEGISFIETLKFLKQWRPDRIVLNMEISYF